LPAERAAEFNAIGTRLTLPPALIERAIAAGRDAARSNALLQQYKAARRP
jgi:hypothetical protein